MTTYQFGIKEVSSGCGGDQTKIEETDEKAIADGKQNHRRSTAGSSKNPPLFTGGRK